MPRLDRLWTGLPAQKIILGFTDTKFKRSPHSRHDSSSFAPKCCSNAASFRAIVALANGDSDFRRMITRKSARQQARNARLEPPLKVSIDLQDAV
jgi:hypothetical protein